MADFPTIPGDAFTSDQLALLDEPLNAQLLKERDGAGGKKLKYLDGRTAIETANRIFGKGKWGFRIVARTHEKIEAKDNKPAQEYFTADIELYVAGNPFPFPGDGIGGVKSNTVEGIEMARKDAVTDALKRALCYYGDQFGLSLRDKDGEPLVEIADGVLVKVNEVQVNKTGANTVKPSAVARVNAAPDRAQIAAPRNNNGRVVDAKPIATIPSMRQIAATASKYQVNSQLAGIVAEARRHYQLGSDDEFSPDQCADIAHRLTEVIRTRKAS